MNRYTASVTAIIDGDPHTLSIDFEADTHTRALDLGKYRCQYLRAHLENIAATHLFRITALTSVVSIWSEHE